MMLIDVIVVEDKHPILRSIVKKIENFSDQLRVVGEAGDGLTALELIRRFKPSIVFTDIRMPGLDGLQLISEIKKIAPETICIIISGYNEFDYARQAMKLGVTEYLLKPITQPAMNEILTKVIQVILDSRQSREWSVLSHIIRGGNITTTASVDPNELPYDSYFVMLICAGSISRFQIDISNPLCEFWMNIDFAAFPSMRISQPFWTFDGQKMNEMIVVLACHNGQNINFERITREIHHHIAPSGVPLTFAISNRVNKVSDLKLEYQVTRAILDKYAVFGKSSVIFVKDAALNRPIESSHVPSFDQQKLISLIKYKKKNAFLSEIETSLKKWEDLGLTQSAMEYNLSQIIHESCKALVEDNHISHSNINLELDEIVSISKDYRALFKNLSFLFEHFFKSSEAPESHSVYLKEIMERIVHYFLEHLSEKITINDIADMVNLNISYLSREFKKYKGLTPIEYLTHLRIEKAKQLLTDSSNLMFKDIATMVGYQNQYYFSKVFKMITGLSPTEFKLANQS